MSVKVKHTAVRRLLARRSERPGTATQKQVGNFKPAPRPDAGQGCPRSRTIGRVGSIASQPVLGDLHHSILLILGAHAGPYIRYTQFCDSWHHPLTDPWRFDILAYVVRARSGCNQINSKWVRHQRDSYGRSRRVGPKGAVIKKKSRSALPGSVIRSSGECVLPLTNVGEG
jgi:hypothetical protein